MGRIVSASEANQSFSRILGQAEAGDTIVIERRGKPIAKLVPTEMGVRERRIAAGERMLAHFEARPNVDIGSWTRAEVYDDVGKD